MIKLTNAFPTHLEPGQYRAEQETHVCLFEVQGESRREIERQTYKAGDGFIPTSTHFGVKSGEMG